jgi:PilZ domain-containing protein
MLGIRAAGMGNSLDRENAPVDFFGKSGALPDVNDNARGFPRYYYRTWANAIIHPIGKGEPLRCSVITRDLSRNGISLLHSTQLFTGQRIELDLNEKAPRAIEVVRCRRIGDACYVIGCRFVKAE